MQRMTDALSRMLNDPSTRLAMRTLSDREVAATRNYQRSQSEQQIDEGEEIPSNNNSPAPELNVEDNTVRIEDDNHTNEVENTEGSEAATEISLSNTVKSVPNIIIERCSQNVSTDYHERTSSSKDYQTEKSEIEVKTRKTDDDELRDFDSNAVKETNEKSEIPFDSNDSKTGQLD